MTNEEFKYWIHGYLTLSSEDSLDAKQITVIKNHADLVKTVTNELHEDIIQFITMLDEKLKQHHQVNIANLKNKAYKLLVMSS